MTQQDLDRNAAATPYKLKKAREKGQVAKSADLVSAVVFASAAVYLAARGWDDVHAQLRLDHGLLRRALDGNDGLLHSWPRIWPFVATSITTTLAWLAPLFATLMAAAIAASLVQTGPLLTIAPLKADASRLNPVAGLKRLFSQRTLFDAARACLKLAVLGLVSWHALVALAPQFHGLAFLAPAALARVLIDDLGTLGLRCASAMVLIALLDLLWSRREFARNMRMSQRDLKDEARHREGDPRIRSRLRELRNAMRRRSRTVQQTRHASIVLVNPLHLAVALRYVHGEMAAPVLLAKGAGQAAARMREIAARHAIPVIQNAPLARRLFREMDVAQTLPPQLFADVARILVWLMAQPGARADGHAAGARQPAGKTA